MQFSERAKTIALAIVKIFETSKPFGDYSAVAVLDDGAGISYGVSQFTHKSGSLHAVLERYGKLGGLVPDTIIDARKDFESGRNILKHSNNKPLRSALRSLGKDPLMQQAQREIAFEKYLKPALDACEGSNFVLPLSLAVIYDSMNHGSYAKIRDRVQLELPASTKPEQYEREWITSYVRERHTWLNSVERLKKTAYRTQFFLDQIARVNWNLALPVNVHGFKLTEEILFPNSTAPAVDQTTSGDLLANNPATDSAPEPSIIPDPNPSPSVDPVTETKTTEVTQEGGKTTAVEQSQTVPAGDHPSVTPTQVSQNGPLAKWLAGGGGAAVGLYLWNYIQSNPSAVAIGIVCLTALIFAIIFRGTITDAIRMQTAADPDKKNVT